MATNDDLSANYDTATKDRYFTTPDGLTHVIPYLYAFETRVKVRWEGRSVSDVFMTEFPHLGGREYWDKAVAVGRLRVNDKEIASPDVVVRPGDKLTHIVHRHEAAVATAEMPILLSDPDCVAVQKPSGLPIHPCGQYRYNSLLGHLAAFQNLPGLKVVHRLDAATSGVVILARTSQDSRKFNTWFEKDLIRKEYYAEVVDHNGILTVGEEIECSEPVGLISHHPNLHGVLPVEKGGKPAHSRFKPLSRDGSRVVVHCFPSSGRTHQLRIHLKHLGCIIVGDSQYGSEVEAQSSDPNTAIPTETLESSRSVDATAAVDPGSNPSHPKRSTDETEFPDSAKRLKPDPEHSTSPTENDPSHVTDGTAFEHSEDRILIDGAPPDPLCPTCTLLRSSRLPGTGENFPGILSWRQAPPVIHLHAIRYSLPDGRSILASIPRWAKLL